MKKKNNNIPKKEPRDISPETRKNISLLLVNTVVLTFIYFGSMAIDQPVLSLIVTVGFWGGAAGFLIAYIIYNRAFTRRGVTVDMLPDSWSEEKKLEFVNNGQKRFEKSKWMICVIAPLMLPILLDAISLFTWPIIQNLFSFL